MAGKLVPAVLGVLELVLLILELVGICSVTLHGLVVPVVATGVKPLTGGVRLGVGVVLLPVDVLDRGNTLEAEGIIQQHLDAVIVFWVSLLPILEEID